MSSEVWLPSDQLASALKVLGSPTRLQVLAALKLPRPLRELRVTPQDDRAGSSPDRPIALTAVQKHIRLLEKHGLVRGDDEPRGRRYVVDRPRLYALAEAVSQLAALSGDHRLAGDRTIALDAASAPEAPAGPRLTLVRGAYEGRSYALEEASSRDGGDTWELGRAPDVAVSLDYDPYVSRRHAVIERTGTAYAVRDLQTSRNGTQVNWSWLEGPAPHALRPGDVLGVGRSFLVFADG
ncbi:MAG: FHA domain-containing protein [Thermoplasmatota archaeon]